MKTTPLIRNWRGKEYATRMRSLRKEYASFVKDGIRSGKLLDALEQRYQEALKSNTNLNCFFEAESEALAYMKERERNLVRRYHSIRIEQIRNFKDQEGVTPSHKNIDFRKIRRYPALQIHQDSSNKLTRLAGALANFRAEHWDEIEQEFRVFSMTATIDSRINIELQWRDLTESGEDGLPPRFDKYKRLLMQFPRSKKAIEWEERYLLYEIATFLMRLHNHLSTRTVESDLSEEEVSKLRHAESKLMGILTDFNLLEFTNTNS